MPIRKRSGRPGKRFGKKRRRVLGPGRAPAENPGRGAVGAARNTVHVGRSMRSFLRHSLRPEVRSITKERSSAIPQTGTALYLLNISGAADIKQGTDDSEYIGGHIFIKHSVGFFKLSLHASSTVVNTIRILFVKWYNDTNPAVTDIIDTSLTATATNNVFAPFKRNSASSYKVLHDTVYQLSSTAGDDFPSQKIVRFMVKWNEESRISPSANMQTYRPCVLFISDQSTNTPTFDMVHRLAWIG